LSEGVAAVRRAWEDAGREGRPRIVTDRYCSLGPDAEATADAYVRHYYGDEFFEAARADTLTDAKRLSRELERIGLAGCDDLLLFPCCGDLEQIALLTEALES